MRTCLPRGRPIGVNVRISYYAAITDNVARQTGDVAA